MEAHTHPTSGGPHQEHVSEEAPEPVRQVPKHGCHQVQATELCQRDTAAAEEVALHTQTPSRSAHSGVLSRINYSIVFLSRD